jgi:hypothetical protein
MFNVLKLCIGSGCDFAFSQFKQTLGKIGFRFITESAHDLKICMELVTGKQLTPETEFLLDKLTVLQLLSKFSAFEVNKRFTAARPCLHPKPDQSIPRSPILICLRST